MSGVATPPGLYLLPLTHPYLQHTMYVTPYLNFDGQCRAAFEFYAQCLGGKIEAMMTHGEAPIADQVPEDWHDAVLHACLVSGDLTLMGSDAPSASYQAPGSMYVALHVDTPEEADRVFGALSDGGTVTMPIEETFWAARFGMLVDRFGVPWMVNCAPSA